MINTGQVCIKNAGREKGEVCVIIDKLDEKFVIVFGPKVRKRRCNLKHLKFLPKKLEIKKDTKESEILKLMVEANLIKKEETKPISIEKKKKSKEVTPKKSKKDEATN